MARGERREATGQPQAKLSRSKSRRDAPLSMTRGASLDMAVRVVLAAGEKEVKGEGGGGRDGCRGRSARPTRVGLKERIGPLNLNPPLAPVSRTAASLSSPCTLFCE